MIAENFAMGNAMIGTRFRLLCAALACLALAASSCQTSVTGACTADFTPVMSVTVRDSASGALLPNAVIRASLGTRTDSAVVGPEATYPVWLGWDAGTYAVTVQAAGYSTWSASQTATYTDRACGHFATVDVAALMQRAP